MTNEEINALTDEQINEMIEKLTYRSADYCSDAGYMMPIAFDYGISIIKDEWGNFYAGFAKDDIRGLTIEDEFYDRKPCRAAAIVYLKMREVL